MLALWPLATALVSFILFFYMLFGLFKDIPQPTETIQFYNSATRELEDFTALKSGRVSMYSCGPTVYDHAHIGNLRAYLLPDLLTRLFQHYGYNVEAVINFTDFGHLTDDADAGEDKMMKGLKREGLPVTLESMREFAETYIDSFKTDMELFGNLPPKRYARASDYVKQQINLIETLMEKGYAYEISDGVYFEVSKFPTYGVLGNVDIEKLKAGARVEANPEKHHPADFALWKKGKLGWNSKWGQGFPGWHIECTAMIFSTLGKQIDIHTGGEDLMYTHHNGEIAQAECATGKKYVGYWLHNAHITLNDDKLAKSTGNILRLQDLIDKGYSPLDYRYWLLQSHYRSGANFSFAALDAAKQARLRLRRVVYEELAEVKPGDIDADYQQQFLSALGDDLDTPKAVAVLWDLVKDAEVAPANKLATIKLFDSLLNLGLSNPVSEGQAELGFVDTSTVPAEIHSLLEEREAARAVQNWAEADRLREAINVKGYEVEDTPEGAKLSKN